MSDDAVVFGILSFIFINEIESAGERNLTQILIKLLLCHSDAVVRYGYRFVLLIGLHGYTIIVIYIGHLSERTQSAELRDCVTGIGNDLAQENILIRIEPFFYDREYVLGFNRYPAFFDFFFHGFIILSIMSIQYRISKFILFYNIL